MSAPQKFEIQVSSSSSGCALLGSGSIVQAGSTQNAYNYVNVTPFTVAAGATFYVVQHAANYNEAVYDSLAGYDNTCAGGTYEFSVNFKYYTP